MTKAAWPNQATPPEAITGLDLVGTDGDPLASNLAWTRSGAKRFEPKGSTLTIPPS